MSITCCTEFTKPITHRPFKVGTYADFGPPSIPNAPIGAIYVDKHTNKTWMLNSQRKWVQMLTFADFGIDYTEHKEKAKCNCRNCGAPVYGYKCEYCDTHY